jgi:VanZ family protein
MHDGGRRAKQPLFSAAAGGYAAVLVAATHYPTPEDFLGPNSPSDKLLHFVAYLILGILTAAAVVARRRLGWRAAVFLVAGLAVFAALDEITQPLFHRAAEPFDWVFDCAGIVAGIGLVAIGAARWPKSADPGSPTASSTPS